jgi:hypothetical protein
MFNTSGARAVKSLAADIELAEILTPSDARANEKAAKNRHARFGQ